jgi:poly(ADP-ribose) glycohydrolase ARH3
VETSRSCSVRITGPALEVFRAAAATPHPPGYLSLREVYGLRGTVPPALERITGSLLGAACGDALGAPFEGRALVDREELLGWSAQDAMLSYTDDTAMMRTLARHLGAHDGRVLDDRLMLEFADNWRVDPRRGYGAGPPQVFRAALAGGDWRGVARSLFGGAGSLGNGGAMRTAPVAFLPGSITERVGLARQQAALTHAHPLALDGAGLLCAAIVLAQSTDHTVSEQFLAEVAPHVHTAEFREALDLVDTVVRRRLPPAEIGSVLGNSVSALASVPTAVAVFQLNPDAPEAAILDAVQAGGDTDTIASMTGALVGARCGESALPDAWLNRLEDAEELRRCAELLFRLHQ